MIYVVDATNDCPSSFTPEVYDDLNRAVENLFFYNKELGEVAYTINRYDSVDDWKEQLELDDDDRFYDFTTKGGE